MWSIYIRISIEEHRSTSITRSEIFVLLYIVTKEMSKIKIGSPNVSELMQSIFEPASAGVVSIAGIWENSTENSTIYFRHMPEAWLHFTVIVSVQMLLLIVHAYSAGRLADVPRLFGWGALIGVAVGVPFDLVVGQFFEIHSYALGFSLYFLVINAALSYGLFVANTLLLQHVRLPYFCLWTVIMMAVYEITNHFFRVWTWEFGLPRFEFLMVLLIGYFAGAILAAIISQVFLGYRFSFLVPTSRLDTQDNVEK